MPALGARVSGAHNAMRRLCLARIESEQICGIARSEGVSRNRVRVESHVKSTQGVRPIGGLRVAAASRAEGYSMHFATVVDRVRTDFMAMPRLELTLGQAVRLWNVGADDCRYVLDALVDAGLLRWTTRGTIVRADYDPYTNDREWLPSHISVRRAPGPYRRA